jgi:sirohydrochlorin cobaltochelatase
MSRGLLLFAHGARDSRWAAPFEAVAARIRQLDPALEVGLGFLEFMSPDLREAARALIGKGCTQVDVVPLFLGAGGHVRRDLPALMVELATAHPDVHWVLKEAIGEHPDVIEAMAKSAME